MINQLSKEFSTENKNTKQGSEPEKDPMLQNSPKKSPSTAQEKYANFQDYPCKIIMGKQEPGLETAKGKNIKEINNPLNQTNILQQDSLNNPTKFDSLHMNNDANPK